MSKTPHPATWRGLLATVLLVANTLFWCTLLFALALLRLLLPFTAVRHILDPVINRVATAWVSGNSGWMRLTQRTTWDVQGLEALSPRGWYLVVANHQSWVDIFVLQHLLNRRIPLLKFFLKRELIWVPVMGLAWWALDFPFMRRSGERRGDDIEAARRACARFALVPTSVMNFVEGTRFTAAKHAAQGGELQHLLRPRAGGLAMAMHVLGDRFDDLLDVTIVYPDGVPSFWRFLCGGVPRIVVRVQEHPIPAAFSQGDPTADPAQRREVQRWLEALWARKDAQIAALQAGVNAS